MANRIKFKIKETLKDLDLLYQEHIEAFNLELLPDLETQSVAREKLFQYLIENRDALSIPKYKNEISDLLHRNQMLLGLAEQQRKQLAQNIKDTSKGKKALAGYGQLTRKSKMPKVMSFKG